MSGRYVGEPVLLRNRPVSGRPALHVLQPLLVQGGALDRAVLVVDRGWVRSGEDESTLLAPRAPQDPVEVVVRLRQEERSSGRDAPPGQVLRRKERRDAAEAAEAAGVPASLGASADVVPVSRPAPRRRRRPTAEEEEDALLDAQTVRRQDP